MKKYQVKDCSSVEEFCNKYHRPDRYHARGEEYVKADLKSHIEDVKKFGYTFIPKYNSITGEIVSYYEN